MAANALSTTVESDLETSILAVGRRLAQRGVSPARLKRLPQEQGMALVARNPELKAALFQLVDVAPACRSPRELADHLEAFLSGIERRTRPVAVAERMAGGRGTGPLSGRVAARAIAETAGRFIVGETPERAAPELRRLWTGGSALSVDLLGESTVTREEGGAYARRCDEALVALSRAASAWPATPVLEQDSLGVLPRVNLSVKVTALTPLVRAAAPDRGREDAADHLRGLLRRAKSLGAHLHVDMESLDSRETVLGLVLDLLAEEEFRDGPSAGLVLQAYLRDSEEVLERILAWADRTPRTTPLGIRLVKGAYWDHEVIDAAQHGWAPPVWTLKADSDRCYERLTRRLIDRYGVVRPAFASHNLRSVAHAIAYADHRGLAPGDVELQVLRGLGDELQSALVRDGYRCRTYCPVGDLVSGMAYLVRRLLENTANDSFLATHAAGAEIDDLLRQP